MHKMDPKGIPMCKSKVIAIIEEKIRQQNHQLNVELLTGEFGIEEILNREIKKFGRDTAHITGISKEHVGKTARIIIKKPKEEKNKWKIK